MSVTKPARWGLTRLCRVLSLFPLLLGCHDFSLPAVGSQPPPTILEIAPAAFFAGQTLTLTGEHLDADRGETPQILVSGIAVRQLSSVEGGGDAGLQTVTVEAPSGLQIGATPIWRATTSAGSSTLFADPKSRYLGLGHPAETGQVRSSSVNLSPDGLAYAPGVLMVVDDGGGTYTTIGRPRLLVLDPDESDVKQVIALQVPGEDGVPEEAWIRDVSLNSDGSAAVVAYQTVDENEDAKGTGLVALARCGDTAQWAPVRNLGFDLAHGTIDWLLYSKEHHRFYGAMSSGAVVVAAESGAVGNACPASLETAGAQVAPASDSTWEHEQLVLSGPAGFASAWVDSFALSGEETLAAISISYYDDDDEVMASTLDLLDLSGGSLAMARHIERDVCPGLGSACADGAGAGGCAPPSAGSDAGTGCPGDEATSGGGYPSGVWACDEASAFQSIAFVGERLAVLDENGRIFVEPTLAGWCPTSPKTQIDLNPLTFRLHSTPDGKLLASGSMDLYLVDPALGRAVGSVVTNSPMLTVVCTDNPGVTYTTALGTSTVGGSLLVFDRDALIVTDHYDLVYSLESVAYSEGAGELLAAPAPQVATVAACDPGNAFVGFAPVTGLDGATALNLLSVDAVAATRSLTAVAGRLASSSGADRPVVRFAYADPDGTSSTSTTAVLRSGSDEPYRALAPWGSGVLGLKTGSFERVATDSTCQGDESTPLPAPCTQAFPAQVQAIPDRRAAFAAAEGDGGAGLILVPQRAEGPYLTTRVAAALRPDGTFVGEIVVPNDASGWSDDAPWEVRALSSSRDGMVVAVVVEKLDEDGETDDTDLFLVLGGDFEVPQEVTLNGSSLWPTSVAVSPDGKVVYLGTMDGKLTALSPHPAPFGATDFRLVAALGSPHDTVSALSVTPDGAFVSALLASPNSSMLLFW